MLALCFVSVVNWPSFFRGTTPLLSVAQFCDVLTFGFDLVLVIGDEDA